jgi:FlaG/FlaF family flagellin (archaellin)
MQLKRRPSMTEDETGVENAVYGILMIAIVVVVALMIGSVVLSQGGQIQLLTGSPKASLTGVLSGGSSPNLLINHESGDTIEVAQISVSVYDDNGILIGTTLVSSIEPAISPDSLSPGLQTSAIPLNISSGKSVIRGEEYTIKITDTRSKQQIGMMTIPAR